MKRFFIFCYVTPHGFGDNQYIREGGKFPNRREATEAIAKDVGCEQREVVLLNIIELSEEDFIDYYA